MFIINKYINFIIISYVFDTLKLLRQFIIIKNSNDVTIIILSIYENVNIIINLPMELNQI